MPYSGQRPDSLTIRTQWLLVALILLGSAALRLNLLDVPLDRDEGEYAYAGQLILRGEALYDAVYTMKLPGTHVAYAVIMSIFGQSARGIHFGLLVLTAANQLLLFAIGRRLLGSVGGLVACAAFGLLELSPSVLGASANTEHFVLAPGLLGLLLSLRALEGRERWSLPLAGLCFGVAIIMKQHGAMFAVTAAAALAIHARTSGWTTGKVLRGSLLLAAFALVPLIGMVVVLALQGALDGLVFWVMQYSLQYVEGVEPSFGLLYLRTTFGAIFQANPAIWIAGLLGLVITVRRGPTSLIFSLLIPLTATSALAVTPGLYFRAHYFVLALPAASLASAAGLTWLRDGLAGRLPGRWANAAILGLALLLGGHSLHSHQDVLFRLTPEEISRKIYGDNPFVESPHIARELAERTGPEEKIAILGSEPQILVYARRLSASPYIYTYPLMGTHPFAREMQGEMIAQIRSAAPRFIVFVNVATSWLATEDSNQRIVRWAERYLRKHYRRVGLVELSPNGPARVHWGESRANPRSKSWVAVFERNS